MNKSIKLIHTHTHMYMYLYIHLYMYYFTSPLDNFVPPGHEAIFIIHPFTQYIFTRHPLLNHSFFNKYILTTYPVPGMVSDTENSTKYTKKPSLCVASIFMDKNRQ